MYSLITYRTKLLLLLQRKHCEKCNLLFFGSGNISLWAKNREIHQIDGIYHIIVNGFISTFYTWTILDVRMVANSVLNECRWKWKCETLQTESLASICHSKITLPSISFIFGILPRRQNHFGRYRQRVGWLLYMHIL